jgi:hypothetical protein
MAYLSSEDAPMSVNDWKKLAYNSEGSFHKATRTIIGTASTSLARTVNYYPEKTLGATIPYVRSQFLYNPLWMANRGRFEARIQISVFTANNERALASKIFGELMAGYGFNPESLVHSCAISQYDYYSNRNSPEQLYDMHLEMFTAPGQGPESDPNAYHLMADFYLYHKH